MPSDDNFPVYDDNFPNSDDIFKEIISEIEGCNKIIHLSTITYNKPLYGHEPLKTLVALKIAPTYPIFNPKELNAFAEENLVDIFSPIDFEFQESTIYKKPLSKYIPLLSKSFMRLPILKRKEISDQKKIGSTNYPGHEIDYQILLFPNHVSATNFNVRPDTIKEDYSISRSDLTALECGVFTKVNYLQ
ncbi:MAG: hypothetical protein GQ477_04200 [Nanohaloarchaea archaeon]|nr:hypothetical protein [Candidatus Nanohaloarchaea archaeon]